jgi:hypothetical protein
MIKSMSSGTFIPKTNSHAFPNSNSKNIYIY